VDGGKEGLPISGWVGGQLERDGHGKEGGSRG